MSMEYFNDGYDEWETDTPFKVSKAYRIADLDNNVYDYHTGAVLYDKKAFNNTLVYIKSARHFTVLYRGEIAILEMPPFIHHGITLFRLRGFKSGGILLSSLENLKFYVELEILEPIPDHEFLSFQYSLL